jgi:hypothetical protein
MFSQGNYSIRLLGICLANLASAISSCVVGANVDTSCTFTLEIAWKTKDAEIGGSIRDMWTEADTLV